ncbi:MAG TPA: ribbon-helix-helix protein, CopG family [Bacteroidetes bacterium]|nr:ribbon-helix-helix protein, CopG family [Bacteroidota bacterium]
MLKTVSFKLEEDFLEEVETLSKELHQTKSALIKNSLEFYLDNYDGIIAKTRDEDPNKQLIDHEDVLREYGLL